jgi:hypothetical protein
MDAQQVAQLLNVGMAVGGLLVGIVSAWYAQGGKIQTIQKEQDHLVKGIQEFKVETKETLVELKHLVSESSAVASRERKEISGRISEHESALKSFQRDIEWINRRCDERHGQKGPGLRGPEPEKA